MTIETNTGTFAKTGVSGPHTTGMYNTGEAQTPALYIAGRAINLLAFSAFMGAGTVAGVVIFADLGLVVKSDLVADWVQTQVEASGPGNGEGVIASVKIPSEDIGGSTFAGAVAPAPLALTLSDALTIAPSASMSIVDFADLLLQAGYSKVDLNGVLAAIS